MQVIRETRFTMIQSSLLAKPRKLLHERDPRDRRGSPEVEECSRYGKNFPIVIQTTHPPSRINRNALIYDLGDITPRDLWHSNCRRPR
jgi:hypothetical protein